MTWRVPRGDAGVIFTTPRQAATTIAANPRLARGSDERFTGYGAMGVPFIGGCHLGLRDVVASSLGTPYRTVWYRDPVGRWTIFTSVDPDVSCPRYFGSVTAVEQVPAIDVTWRDDWTVDVTIGARLSRRLRLGGGCRFDEQINLRPRDLPDPTRRKGPLDRPTRADCWQAWGMESSGWVGVRCVFRSEVDGLQTFEERVTLWKAPDVDAAIQLAEHEASVYANDCSATYTGLAQGFLLADAVGTVPRCSA